MMGHQCITVDFLWTTYWPLALSTTLFRGFLYLCIFFFTFAPGEGGGGGTADQRERLYGDTKHRTAPVFFVGGGPAAVLVPFLRGDFLGSVR